MKTWIVMGMMLTGLAARAEILAFDGSQAAGTEKMERVKAVEFLFDAQADSVRLCGAWLFADGHRQRFEETWSLAGSNVMKDGKSLGSYFNGNFLIEENVGGSKFQAIEVSREQEKWFEYHFHHPDLGFVDADGWLTETPSASLARDCAH